MKKIRLTIAAMLTVILVVSGYLVLERHAKRVAIEKHRLEQLAKMKTLSCKKDGCLIIAWAPDLGREPTNRGYVSLEGWYREPNGQMHPWGTQSVCELRNEIYVCETEIPAGSQLVWDIHYAYEYAYEQSPSGRCWIFDQSDDKPCGGDGDNVGIAAVINSGSIVPYTLAWNGLGPSNPPVYFNAQSEIPNRK